MLDAEKLQEYVGLIRKSHSHDAKRLHFLNWMEQQWGVDLASCEIEERVYGGRIDALLGKLVFEFKTSFPKELDDAQHKLARYIAELSTAHPGQPYTGIATDGITFYVFTPHPSEAGTELRLQLLAQLDLAQLDLSRETNAEKVFLWFDSLFAHFKQEPLAPTTQHIVANLGPVSPTYRTARLGLERLYRRVEGEPQVQVRFREWRRYLAIVYGTEIGDVGLFLNHTYLVTLAKLLAFFNLNPTAALADDQELANVVTGDYFRHLRILNFIEEDFFTWPLRPSIRKEGLGLLRRLAHSLRVYRFDAIQEDVLKELYQGLVDPETRHDLGEYYTPDWLAEYMLREAIRLPEKPDQRLLDPSCGSGTFLFLAVRLMRAALEDKGMAPTAILRHILSHVVGIDVHPLAAIVARTNYLLALGDLLQKRGAGDIPIPVYLADAIRLPRSTREDALTPAEHVHYPEIGDQVFEFPDALVQRPEVLDRALEGMRDYLRETGDKEDLTAGYLQTLAQLGVDPKAATVMGNTFRRVFDLFQKGEDTIWLFLLKNAHRPTFLRQQGVDALVGNPPWLSLRYLRNPVYRAFVRRQLLNEYRLLSKGQTHLFTHLELATLFFARTADLYLRQGGAIAFVMPRAIMSADQHATFTQFAFKADGSLSFTVKMVADLEAVKPLFNVPTCVLAAQKGGHTPSGLDGVVVAGELYKKNARWAEAQSALSFQPQPLHRVHGKLLFSVPAGYEQALGVSPYARWFYEGATIVPRNFWFVEVEASTRLGFDPQRPPLRTSEEVAAQSKAPWRDIRLSGSVEADFLYGTLLGGDLVPFGHLPFRPVVLPAQRQPNGKLALVNAETARQMGRPGLADWLEKVEGQWRALARRDERGGLRIATSMGRVDYQHGLTNQLLSRGYKVLYTAAGTNIAACLVDMAAPLTHPVDGSAVPLQGFVADCKAFYYESDVAGEAYYLTGFLNSSMVNELIKPSQSRGLWGERDIHKKPLKVRIPLYDAKNRRHRRLAELGEEAQRRAAAALPELAARGRSTAWLRGRVRDLLQEGAAREPPLREIDRLVGELLGL